MSGYTAYAEIVLEFGPAQVNSAPCYRCCYRWHALNSGMTNKAFPQLIAEIRNCAVCAAELPFEPHPVLRGLPTARLLIISQAPGIRAHESGRSFDDRSGDRLRDWLGIGRDTFYDQTRVAAMP